MMRQLDLFGMPEEPKKPEEKKPSAIVVQMQQPENAIEEAEEPAAVAEEIVVEEEIILPEPTPAKSTVVFEDDKIGVKIKAVQKPAVQTPEQSIAEPIAAEPDKTIGKRGRKSFKEMDAEADLTEVPEDEILFSKQYYSISQVATWFKVNNSLIRYWENEFDVLKPRKNRKGDRLFRPEDVKNLQLIYHLLRQRKFTIEGAKDYLKAHKGKADVNMQLVQSLTKFKSFLLELRANLDA